MDHLMPGMDGFQAIQAIKGNPDTATIPVMMYTSQEGELYVSQARALGAVGVLPKTVKQADVSRVLYQLRLLPERRESRPRGADGLHGPGNGGGPRLSRLPCAIGEIETAIRAAIAPLLKEHSTEMRRFVLASLEAFARRIGTEMKPAAAPPPPPTPMEAPPSSAAPESLAAGRRDRGARVAADAGARCLHTRTLDTMTRACAIEHASSRRSSRSSRPARGVTPRGQGREAAAVDRGRRAPRLRSECGIRAGAVWRSTAVGRAAGTPARHDRAAARRSGFRGKVKVATFVGEFCLTGNGIEGYSMAADDLPVKRCDLRRQPLRGRPAAPRSASRWRSPISSSRSGRTTADALTHRSRPRGPPARVPYPGGRTAGEGHRRRMEPHRLPRTTAWNSPTQPAGVMT